MRSLLTLLVLISFAVEAQFTSGTTKQIDEINNNTATDITIDPVNQVVIPYLNTGELVIDDGTGLQSLANGTEGQLLSITGGVLDFIDPPASSPLTTKGDIYVYDTDNQRLGVGTAGQILSVDLAEATGLKWIDPPLTSPTTTIGDLIYNNTGVNSGDTRLAIGTEDQLLTVKSGVPSWEDAPVSTTLTAKGEIQGHDGANNVAIPTAAGEGYNLVSDSNEASGVKWSQSIQGKMTVVTNWESFTPTGTWSTNATYLGKFRRVGENLEVKTTVNLTGAPSPSVSLQVDLPPGLVIDVTKMDSSVQNDTQVGDAYYRDVSLARAMGKVAYYDTTSVRVFLERITGNNDTASTTPTVPHTWESGDSISFSYSVPIQGWQAATDAAAQDIELSAATVNSFTVDVSNTGVVTGDIYDFINGDCTNTAPQVCTWNTGIFTEIPQCFIETEHTGGNETGKVTTLTNISVYRYDSSGTSSAGQGYSLTCKKKGADVNKSQVIAGTFENINSTDLCQVNAHSNDSDVIGAAYTEDIPFKTITKDTCNAWSNAGNTDNNTADAFTAPRDMRLQITGLPVYTGGISGMDFTLFVNGVTTTTKCGRNNAIDSQALLACTIELLEGDVMTLRVNDPINLSNTTYHKIEISETADYEAIVKNLYNEKTECETKYLQANNSSVGILSDLTFPVSIGGKYSISGQLQLTTGAGVQTFNSATPGVNQLGYNFSDGSRTISYAAKKFLATQDTVITYKPFAATVNGNGTTALTWMQLCKLPDSTILN